MYRLRDIDLLVRVRSSKWKNDGWYTRVYRTLFLFLCCSSVSIGSAHLHKICAFIRRSVVLILRGT